VKGTFDPVLIHHAMETHVGVKVRLRNFLTSVAKADLSLEEKKNRSTKQLGFKGPHSGAKRDVVAQRVTLMTSS
jgi:hypothetical protein